MYSLSAPEEFIFCENMKGAEAVQPINSYDDIDLSARASAKSLETLPTQCTFNINILVNIFSYLREIIKM